MWLPTLKWIRMVISSEEPEEGSLGFSGRGYLLVQYNITIEYARNLPVEPSTQFRIGAGLSFPRACWSPLLMPSGVRDNSE